MIVRRKPAVESHTKTMFSNGAVSYSFGIIAKWIGSLRGLGEGFRLSEENDELIIHTGLFRVQPNPEENGCACGENSPCGGACSCQETCECSNGQCAAWGGPH